jgi:prolipoprotein diacylglyceryltransferase
MSPSEQSEHADYVAAQFIQLINGFTNICVFAFLMLCMSNGKKIKIANRPFENVSQFKYLEIT